MAQIEDHAEWAKEDQQEIRERSREIEEAALPELKTQINDSMESFADKLLQLETEIEGLRQELRERQSAVTVYDGTLSENDILKVVGVILSNDKLAEYLGQKIRDKFRDKVKVNFEIG